MGASPAYGIIFSDVDGTLLDSGSALRPRTVAAVRSYAAHGGRFALCTGRMPGGVAHLQQTLGTPTAAVCYSGALVLDELGRTVSSRTLGARDALTVLDIARETGCGIAPSFFVDKEWLAPDPMAENIRREARIVKTAPVKASLQESVERGALPNKIFFNCSLDIEGGGRLADELRAGLRDARVVRSASGVLLEILPAGVDKAVGAADLAGHYGMTMGQAAAFGDDVNDIELLRAVALGVAMGNADERVRRAADVTTASNDEDGVARILESLLD